MKIKVSSLFRSCSPPSAPSVLSFSGTESVLILDEVVRSLPGRRCSYWGQWQGTAVVAKCFYHPWKKHRDCRRELDHHAHAAARKILVPKIVWHGNDQHGLCWVVFERLQHGETAAHLLSGIAQPALWRLIRLLAQHHERGVLQTDPHVGNFFEMGNDWYSLDLSGLRFYRYPLSRRLALNNLAMLMAQWPVNCDFSMWDVYRSYCAAIQWEPSHQQYRRWLLMIDRMRKIRLKKYVRKMMRSNTLVRFEHDRKKTIALYRQDDGPELQSFLNDPERYLRDDKQAVTLKQGRSARLVRVSLDKKPVVIKVFQYRNLTQRIRRWLSGTRAAMNWHHAHVLQFFDLPIARPIAWYESGRFNQRAYYLCAYVPGCSLNHFFQSWGSFSVHEVEIADRVVALLVRMRHCGVVHGDLKASNIQVDGMQVRLLDLDGVQQECLTYRGRDKDLRRFMQNWEQQPELLALFNYLFLQAGLADIVSPPKPELCLE